MASSINCNHSNICQCPSVADQSNQGVAAPFPGEFDNKCQGAMTICNEYHENMNTGQNNEAGTTQIPGTPDYPGPSGLYGGIYAYPQPQTQSASTGPGGNPVYHTSWQSQPRVESVNQIAIS